MASCTIKAYIENSEGKIVESNLHNSLRAYSRTIKEANENYELSKSERFREEFADLLEYDSNEEPTLSSFIKAANITLDADKTVSKLSKLLGAGVMDYDTALLKAVDFNANNELKDNYMAIMRRQSNGQYKLEVVDNTTANKLILEEQVYQKTLSDSINKLLQDKLHIGTLFIDDNSFEGRFSTQNVEQAQDGLYYLVQISNGGAVGTAHAEEAGHAVIASLGDHALVKRLEGLLSNKDVRQALMKEEWANKDLGKNPAREMSGMLVGEALVSLLKGDSLGAVSLANRIALYAKKLFRKLTPYLLSSKAEEAREKALMIAEGFLNNSDEYNVQKALRRKEILYRRRTIADFFEYTRPLTDKDLLDSDPYLKAYSLMISDLHAFHSKWKAYGFDAFSIGAKGSMPGSLHANIENHIKAAATIEGIDNFKERQEAAIAAIMELGTTIINDLDTDIRNAILLNADFTNQYSSYITDENEQASFEVIRKLNLMMDTYIALMGRLKDFSAYGNNNEITYRDPETDKIAVLDVTLFLNELGTKVTSLLQSIDAIGQTWFLHFLTKVYGLNYVTWSARKVFAGLHASNSEEKQKFMERADKTDSKLVKFLKKSDTIDKWMSKASLMETVERSVNIEDLLTGNVSGGLRDISLYASWFSAMLDSGDIILGIVKQAIDLANRKKIKETEKDRVVLNQLLDRLRKEAGHDNTRKFYKMLNNERTGYLLAPVDYGKWERERNQRISELRLTFTEDYDERMGKGAADRVELNDPTTFLHIRAKYISENMKAWDKVHSSYKGVMGNKRLLPNAENIEGKVSYLDPEWGRLSAAERSFLTDYFAWKRSKEALLGSNAGVEFRAPLFRAENLFSKNSRYSNYRDKHGRIVSLAKLLNLNAFRINTDEDRWAFGIDTDSIPDELMLSEEDKKEFKDKIDELRKKYKYESILYDERSASLEAINRLPMVGLRLMLHPNDINTDLIGASINYSYFINNRIQLGNIVNALELGKRVLRKRKIEGTTEALDYGHFSNSYLSYLRHVDRAIYNRLPNTIYGKSFRYSTIAALSKIGTTLKSLGTTLALGFNPNPAIVNVLTGSNEMVKEALANEEFSFEDFRWALWEYAKGRGDNWLSMVSGKVFNEREEKKDGFDRVGAFLMYMDAQNNYGERVNKAKKNYILRVLGNAKFILYSTTDNFMQGVPMLSLAHASELIDTRTGRKVNVFDIYQPEYEILDGKKVISGYGYEENRYALFENTEYVAERLNALLKEAERLISSGESGISFEKFYNDNKDELKLYFDRLGKQLKPEYEYIRLNLSDVLNNLYWNDIHESQFASKAREVSNRLHGIYSTIDSVNFSGTAYGSAELSMKGYALGMLERRFSQNYYNTALKLNVEGSYVSTIKALLDKEVGILNKMELLVNPFTRSGLERTLKEAHYDENQIANMRRTSADMYWMSAMYAMYSLLGNMIANQIAASNEEGPDEDDTVDSFWEKLDHDRTTAFFHYLFYRLYLEQAAFIAPWLVGKELASLLDTKPVGIVASILFASDTWQLLKAAYYYYLDRAYFEKPDKFDYDDKTEYNNALKEYRRRNNWMWGISRDMFELEENGETLSNGAPADASFLKTKQAKKWLNQFPFPTKYFYKMLDYEKLIKSTEFYRNIVAGR